MDVVGCPVKGDGRMPEAVGAGAVFVSTETSAEDDATGDLCTPMLRLRNDMSLVILTIEDVLRMRKRAT